MVNKSILEACADAEKGIALSINHSEVINDEVEKLLSKLTSVYNKVGEYKKFTPEEREDIREILGRAEYCLETDGDESDVRFAVSAIRQAGRAIRNK